MEVKLFWIIVINSLYVLTDEEFSIAPQILKNDLAIISLGLHISTYTILVSEAFTANSAILAHALVPSHIDYCNTILSDLSNKIFHSLQLVHNGAVLVITRTPSVEDITPVLQ